VIQIFGSRLHHVTDGMWGSKFDGPVDVGDVAAAGDIIRIFLKKNPHGKVFIYTVWPNMPAGKVPPDDQLPSWAVEMKQRSGNLRAAEFPDRDAFDYAAQWSKPYQGDFDKPWVGNICRTRDYTNQVFAGIKADFPDLWKQRRLVHIPGGELFFELDKKLQAGAMPGIATIKDFYTDVQHIRAGLPAYAIAALFFAAIFEETPGSLDFRIYNDPQKYGEDPHHDRGEVLPITSPTGPRSCMRRSGKSWRMCPSNAVFYEPDIQRIKRVPRVGCGQKLTQLVVRQLLDALPKGLGQSRPARVSTSPGSSPINIFSISCFVRCGRRRKSVRQHDCPHQARSGLGARVQSPVSEKDKVPQLPDRSGSSPNGSRATALPCPESPQQGLSKQTLAATFPVQSWALYRGRDCPLERIVYEPVGLAVVNWDRRSRCRCRGLAAASG
jgi:hypothetical protein